MSKKVDKATGSKKYRIISIATIMSISVGIIIIVMGMAYYKYRIADLGITDMDDYDEYDLHFAIISEEEDAPFWEEIYQGALEKGKENNIYVEKIGSNLSVKYSLEDLMKISIASKVDGIILEPNGDESIIELINEADVAGIPVITVLRDEPQSNRISFVGINSYTQGQAYGKQVVRIIDEGKKNITVLLNNKDTRQSVIYSSILGMVGSRAVEVRSEVISTESTFSSEEDIRKIIVDKENPPDALVCLTAKDTLSAQQAVVDYNKVGQIDIIGYYDSELILRAIEKNIVHSTMTIDAGQMGAYCVEALMEYRETNNVSDYYSVDISVITKENVDDYIKTKETENAK